jgi:predicted AAA+ superfamily ATPase
MYFKRKIDDYLKEWKNDEDHKPLIVKGARQVGKTESILKFAHNNYSSVIYINFATEKKFLNILTDGYTAEDVVKNISFIDPSLNFKPKETIIIFDEIQEYPDIATSLKSFKLDGNYDVICSGSMLGINYKKIHSNSVGYKTDYNMYSMDFEEFLWALGYKNEQVEDIFNHMMKMEKFNKLEMEVLKGLFLDYSVLGGMPAVIKIYVENHNFAKTLDVQNQIKLDYEEDIRKYAEGLDKAKILSVYKSVPSQLAKENKKYQFSLLGKNCRSREFTGCIEWLFDAGVINICNCMLYPELPIKGNIDGSKFKIYYSDTGLLVSSLDEEAQIDLRANRNLGVYKGALYENFVAEAFVKQDLPLCYYKKENSTIEEDFFVRNLDGLIPIEVKSNDKQSKSLNALINNENYKDIKFGIKLGDFNVGYASNIYTFPYFCAFLIKRFVKSFNFNK